FKAINDSHGHAAGDLVLQAFAARLAGSVRDTDLVARLGGDEFVILLEEASREGAETVARQVIDATPHPARAGGAPSTVSASIGIACADRTTEAGTLMARADAALYAAKNAGRNRYHLATPD